MVVISQLIIQKYSQFICCIFPIGYIILQWHTLIAKPYLNQHYLSLPTYLWITGPQKFNPFEYSGRNTHYHDNCIARPPAAMVLTVYDQPVIVMPPPLGAGGIMFSGCPSVHPSVRLSVRPSVRPKPEIPSFDLYMGPLVHPTNRNRFTACPSVSPSVRPSVRPSVCPSVRPERFPGICRGMAWNFTCWCILTIFRTD